MNEGNSRGISSRRSLIRGGAAFTGLAAATAGVKPLRALALDSPGDSLLNKAVDRGKILVGTGSTNPPWHFEDENGKLVGFDIEMAKIVAGGLFGLDRDQIAGDEEPRKYIEFVVHASDARIPDLLADKVDVNFQFMTVTANRASQVEFTVPYYREGTAILLPTDSSYNVMADLQGQGATIAVLANVYAEEFVHEVVPDADVQQLDSPAALIEAIDAGRADGAAVDLSTARWYVAQDPDAYKSVPETWNPQTYAASVKPGDQIWLNFLNSALHEAMIGVDYSLYQTAFSTYFGEEVPIPSTGFPAEFR